MEVQGGDCRQYLNYLQVFQMTGLLMLQVLVSRTAPTIGLLQSMMVVLRGSRTGTAMCTAAAMVRLLSSLYFASASISCLLSALSSFSSVFKIIHHNIT